MRRNHTWKRIIGSSLPRVFAWETRIPLCIEILIKKLIKFSDRHGTEISTIKSIHFQFS